MLFKSSQFSLGNSFSVTFTTCINSFGLALFLLIFSSFLVSCEQNGSIADTRNISSEIQSFSSSNRKEVKCVTKDKDGDIIAIGGDWGSISKEEAIKDIESGVCEYYVRNGESAEVLIHVVSKKYLRTDRDDIKKN